MSNPERSISAEMGNLVIICYLANKPKMSAVRFLISFIAKKFTLSSTSVQAKMRSISNA